MIRRSGGEGVVKTLRLEKHYRHATKDHFRGELDGLQLYIMASISPVRTCTGFFSPRRQKRNPEFSKILPRVGGKTFTLVQPLQTPGTGT